MPLFEPDGDRFVPTGLSRGPWDPRALNGGPVAALVARMAERHEDAGAPILASHLLARLTVDLVRPVPLAPLTVRTRTVRPGKKVQLVEVLLEADGEVVTRAIGLRMPAPHDQLEPGPHEDPPPVPERSAALPAASPDQLEHFHSHGVEMRVPPVEGRGDGSVAIWIRLAHPLLPGEEASPAARAAATADFGSGMSGRSPAGWRSINADVNVFLFREPVGDWVGYHAITYSAAGVAIAEGGLFDRGGRVGRAVQTVLVEPWDRPFAGGTAPP